jgi:hypothetical protein
MTGGGISGLITGLVGTGGALRATFLTGFSLEKTKYSDSSFNKLRNSSFKRIDYFPCRRKEEIVN